VVWLGGLHAPEAFIAALVQAACRARGWPLDRAALFTTVRARGCCPAWGFSQRVCTNCSLLVRVVDRFSQEIYQEEIPVDSVRGAPYSTQRAEPCCFIPTMVQNLWYADFVPGLGLLGHCVPERGRGARAPAARLLPERPLPGGRRLGRRAALPRSPAAPGAPPPMPPNHTSFCRLGLQVTDPSHCMTEALPAAGSKLSNPKPTLHPTGAGAGAAAGAAHANRGGAPAARRHAAHARVHHAGADAWSSALDRTQQGDLYCTRLPNNTEQHARSSNVSVHVPAHCRQLARPNHCRPVCITDSVERPACAGTVLESFSCSL